MNKEANIGWEVIKFRRLKRIIIPRCRLQKSGNVS